MRTTFTGHNDDGQRQWSMRCNVLVADRPHEFAWATLDTTGGPSNDDVTTRWGYRFTPLDGGTHVEESWELQPAAVAIIEQMPEEQQQMLVNTVFPETLTSMETTLAKLKRVAEL